MQDTKFIYRSQLFSIHQQWWSGISNGKHIIYISIPNGNLRYNFNKICIRISGEIFSVREAKGSILLWSKFFQTWSIHSMEYQSKSLQVILWITILKFIWKDKRPRIDITTLKNYKITGLGHPRSRISLDYYKIMAIFPCAIQYILVPYLLYI